MQLINKLSVGLLALAASANAYVHLGERMGDYSGNFTSAPINFNAATSTSKLPCSSAGAYSIPAISTVTYDETTTVTATVSGVKTIYETVVPVTITKTAYDSSATEASAYPEVVTKVSTATLTYTIGTGATTSVVTTTVAHTSTETVYHVS